VLAGSVVVGAPAAGTTQSPEEAEVLGVVQGFFDAIESKDADAARRTVLPEAVFYGLRELPDGTLPVSPSSGEEFASGLPARSERMLERMWDPSVRIHGRLATVWTPYDFHRDGAFSHCGIDAFTLVRTDEGWRIAGIVWTVENSMPEPLAFRPDPRLFPFESHWFDSSVGQVHYIDEGSGPPILFLHGNPTWSFLYRGIVIRLRDRFRCVAVDYPGFGLSSHPDDYGYTPGEHSDVVGELVDELDLWDLTIMGQDWGGPIGMRVAVDQLPRLRALVMGNTWYWPMDAWHMRAFSAVMSFPAMQSQILQRNLFVDRIMPAAVKYRLAPEVMDHYRGPLSSPLKRVGAAEFPRQLTRAASWLQDLADDVPIRLGEYPLLLVWGLSDLAFPVGFMDRFRKDFADVHVRRLDAKHYIQEDAPAEISEAIAGFLE
jgi:haloalkane dehalogenase